MTVLRLTWPSWRPWHAPWRQHLGVLGLAGSLGFGAVVWSFGPDAVEVDAQEAEVAQWQARLGAPQTVMPVPEPVSKVFRSAWPGPDQAVVVWSWLQQRLQMQGIQVLALRPQAMGTQGLPEQTVWLTLQGRWDDWLVLTQHMAAQAPWWLLDQWQVVPVPGGRVRLEVHARAAWLPAALQDQERLVWEGPVWPVASVASQGAELFGARQAAGAVPSPDVGAGLLASSPVLASDPRHWPVRALQLQGVWQQAGQWYAVLGAGLAQTTVRAGQRLGQEGWHVRHVDEGGVAWTAGQGGPNGHLGWQGGKP